MQRPLTPAALICAWAILAALNSPHLLAAALPSPALPMPHGQGPHSWHMGAMGREVLGEPGGGPGPPHGRFSARMLLPLASGSSATCNCSQAAGLPRQQVLLISDHYGALPQLRHATYLFQQQLIAQGSQSVLDLVAQQFNGPSDLMPLETLNPDYDIAQVEQRVPASGMGGFTAPAWVSAPAGSPPPNASTVQAALQGLLTQSADLVNTMPVLLVYRRDLLAARGLEAPETWAQMLDMAALLNGTDMNGDGVDDYALCVDVDPSCKTYWLFSAVAASLLQYNGTASGYLIDPATGSSLLNTPGMQQALSLWSQLLQYNAAEQATMGYCGMWEDAFTQGRCLFTLGPLQSSSHTASAAGALSLNSSAKAYSWGRTSVAPTPGSTSVYDRASGSMVACDSKSCPLATPSQQQFGGAGAQATVYVNRAPVVMRSDNGREDTRTNKVTALEAQAFASSWKLATQGWVSSALDPVYLATLAARQSWEVAELEAENGGLDLSYYNSSQYIQDAYNWTRSLLAQATTVGWVSPTAVNTTTDPDDHPIPWTGLAEYLGIEAQEATEHLTAAVWSLMHPNLVPDPQMVSPLRITLAVAAACMAQGVNQSLVEGNVAYKLGLWEQVSPAVWNQVQYDQDIGYVAQPNSSSGLPGYPPDANAASWPHSGDTEPQALSSGALAAIVATIGTSAVLLLITVVILLRLRVTAGLDVFGKVRHPELGPATSLLVTDIQSSTTLWEVLPPGVMDRAVRMHHQLLRSLMQEHKGYETCTEGDSFIVAFHTPWDALRYCLAVQSELLTLPWPSELLEAPEAADDASEVQLQYNSGAMDWCIPVESACAYLQDALPGLDQPLLRPCWRQRVVARVRREDPVAVMLREERAAAAHRVSANGWSSKSSMSGMLHSLGLGLTLSVNATDRSTAPPRPALRHLHSHDLETTHSANQPAPGSNNALFLERPSAPTLANRRLSSDVAAVVVRSEDGTGGKPVESTGLTAKAGSSGSLVVSGGHRLPIKAGSSGNLAVRNAIRGRSSPRRAGSYSSRSLVAKQQQMQQQQQQQQQQVELEARALNEGVTLEGWLAEQVHPVLTLADDVVPGLTPRFSQSKLVETVAMRGLRVRMGLHSGLTDPQAWAVNKATGRWCASGPFLSTCKAVGDAGAGGMIVLSRDCWDALMPFGIPPECVALHMGEHQLKDQEGSTALYLALPTPLVSRLSVLPPLRSLAMTSPSVLSAPLGQAAVVFMHAVGVRTLRAWDAEVTRDSLQIYHEAVSRALLEWGGYLMELVDGLCLASFADAGAAVGWALSAQADLMEQDWDRRLLRHELCEEVAVTVPAQAHAAPPHGLALRAGPVSALCREPLAQPSTPRAATAAANPNPLEAALTPESSASEPELSVSLAPTALNAGSLGRLGPASLGRMVALKRHSERWSPLGPKMAAVQEPAYAAEEAAAARDVMSSGFAAAASKRVLLRGLRVKVGIDVGEVHTSLNPATGRMSYWGKVMNRAARISGQAASSQVLCSSLAWSASCSSALPRVQATPILGTSLGPHALKGIADKVTLVHCTLDPDGNAGFSECSL